VLAVADGGLSTPAVYAELDRQRDTGPVGVVGDPSRCCRRCAAATRCCSGRALSNDLQPAAVALRPAAAPPARTGAALGRSACW
jgi:4-diphosphocytidyl-2-C-methyl-D-erythritol kinase